MEYETSPESRLWAAFILSIIRDLVPNYITSRHDDSYNISRMSDAEFRQVTGTAIFRLACVAVNLAPDTLIKRMNVIRLLEPTPSFIERHNERNPEGGSTPIVRVHQYYIEEFYKDE